MRTTLTLDDDVAARLEQLRKERALSFDALVNEALREGLARLQSPHADGEPVRTRVVDLGRCLVDDLDDSSEVIARLEREDFR